MQSGFFRIAVKRFTTIAFPFEESSATNASKKSQIPRGCKPKFLPRSSPVIDLAASTVKVRDQRLSIKFSLSKNRTLR